MNDDGGSYKDYPLSITEIRANNSESARDWTVRDALIAMLRRIDNGEIANADACVVCLRTSDNRGGTKTYFANAAPDHHVTLGLLCHVEHRIMGNG